MGQLHAQALAAFSFRGRGHRQSVGHAAQSGRRADPAERHLEVESEAQNPAWLKAKLQASLDDTHPGVPHDQVMTEMEAIILAVEERHRLQA